MSQTSSPARPSASLTRQHWPWTRASHSSLSNHSTTGSVSGSQGSWGQRPSSIASSPSTVFRSSNTPLRQQTGPTSFTRTMNHQETMRNWSFTAFEWTVRDVHRLTALIESEQDVDGEQDVNRTQDAQDFEILKQSPLLGDGKFKLEIAQAPSANGSSALSLYITSLVVDFSQSDYEMPATMMAAIKNAGDKAGERGARAEWAWEVWQNDWIFRQESEVWECPLPPLSSLLENQTIRETDSFVICVQIHSPVGPFFPQQPSAFYVPKDLLEGLEASLDNPNTGDVQFVCLERMDQSLQLSPILGPSRSPSATSSSAHDSAFSSQTVARKRIIYAHSDILTRRSEYFATMLASAFSESNGQGNWPSRGSERKTHTIVVEEADFVTIYWLLKWVYANWLLFREQDDPRAAVEGIGAGWSAKWLNANGPGEWDWKKFSKASSDDNCDIRSVASGGSSKSGEAKGKGKEQPFQAATTVSPTRTNTGNRTTATTVVGTPTKVSSRQSNTSLSRRTNPAEVKPPGGVGMQVPLTLASLSHQALPPGGANVYPISPRTANTRQHPTPNPHQHPTAAPPPASALSMYQIAHRYSIPGLAALALEHMLSTITPERSFALLLASSMWDELRCLVEDYVVEKWDEVSLTEEFERCCDEVAAGEWGPEGGKALMALFRRLRSPNALPFPRV